MKKTERWGGMSGKRKYLLIAAVISATGLISLGVYSMKGIRAEKAAAQKMPVQETQAELKNISNTIVGTGNLEYNAGVSVTIPSGVVVDEVTVESGDRVSKGDVLAVVNETSVCRAMEDIQEEMDALDEEIDDSKDDTGSQSVKSKVDGKVKKIYVQEGQKVSDCMAAQGALMILSMEDYITAEDETDTQILVTATAGSVEEICVSEGDTVYAGTTLLKIENEGQSLEYREQMAERQKLAETLQKLVVLSQNTTITAESDGIIKTVNISANGSAGETEDAQVSQNMTAIVGSAQNGTSEGGKSQEDQNTSGDETEQENQNTSGDGKEQENQNTSGDGKEQEEQNGEGMGNLLMLKVEESGKVDKDTLVVESPVTGGKPQTTLRAEDGSYEGIVSWTPSCRKFAAETSYQAFISLSAGEGYQFGNNSISQIKTGVLSGINVTEDGKKLSFCITYPFTASEKQGGQNGSEGNGNNDKSQNNSGNAENGNNSGNAENGNNSGNGNNGQNAENGNSGGNEAGNGSGSQNNGGISSQSVSVAASGSTVSYTDSQESTETLSTGSEITAFTIVDSDTIMLSVNVDELDINSVSKGQSAEITLDAMEGETFTGTVSRVGNTASTSSGGVAKYTVELTVPGDERMKEGMNASAVITVEERENVVTIPVNALQERGDRVFVYTQADSEGNLQGEQEVATGLSDGETVEITDGLSEGDSVYYQRSGKISEQDNFPGAGGMEGGPGGSMGDMPKGGFRGGESGGGMPGGTPGSQQ